MKGKKLLCLIGAAAVYAWAVAACFGVRESGDTVYLALEEGAALQAVEEIFAQEKDPIGCCFWGEEEDQAVSCPATGRTAQVTRVYLGGNAELLGVGRLSWQEGLLVDQQTAQDLFGTDVCGGQQILWNGRSYPVLGAVSTLRTALIMRARPEDSMNRCVLALPAENGKQLGEQFLLRFGLKGKVLDFFPLWALARNLLLLAPMVLLVSIYNLQWTVEKNCHCEPSRTEARQSHEDSERRMGSDPTLRMTRFFSSHPCHCEPVRTLVWQSHKSSRNRMGSFATLRMTRFLKLLILALGILLVWRGIVIPPEMIPSRWSDFSFWGRWWEAQKENLRCILFTPLGGRQLQILLNMVKSMAGSILAALLVQKGL